MLKILLLSLLSTIQVRCDVSEILKNKWSNSNSYLNQFTTPPPNWQPITAPSPITISSSENHNSYNTPNIPSNFYLPIPQLPQYPSTTTEITTTTTETTPTNTPSNPWSQQSERWAQQSNIWPEQSVSWSQIFNPQQSGPWAQSATWTQQPTQQTDWPQPPEVTWSQQEQNPWSQQLESPQHWQTNNGKKKPVSTQQPNSWSQQPNSWSQQPTQQQNPWSQQVESLQQWQTNNGKQKPDLTQLNSWSQQSSQQTWPQPPGISWSQQQQNPWSQQPELSQSFWQTNKEKKKPGSFWKQSNFQPIATWMQGDAINGGKTNTNQQFSTSQTNSFLESTVALPPVPQPVVDLSFLGNVTPMTQALFIKTFKNELKPILEPSTVMMPPSINSKPKWAQKYYKTVPMRMLLSGNKPPYFNKGATPQISTSVSAIVPTSSGNQVMNIQWPMVPEIGVFPKPRPPSNQYLPQRQRPQTINYHWKTNNSGQGANKQWPITPPVENNAWNTISSGEKTWKSQFEGNNQWTSPPIRDIPVPSSGIPVSNVQVTYWHNRD